MAAKKGNKYAKGNKGGGRKSSYKKSFANKAFELCLLGTTDEIMAKCFDVSVKTLNEWKKQHKEFSSALLAGKEPADGRVARALFERAVGYEIKEMVPYKVKDAVFVDGIEVEPAVFKNKVVTKKMAPDPTAIRYFLNNRQKKNWKDRHEIGFDPESNTEFEIYIGKKKLDPATKKQA